MNIEYSLLTFQILNIVLLVSWLILITWAISQLRKETLPDYLQLIWVLVILLIPIAGAMAYLIVRKKQVAL